MNGANAQVENLKSVFKEDESASTDTTGIMQKPKQKQQQLREPEAIQKSNRKAGMQFSGRGFADYEQSPGFEP